MPAEVVWGQPYIKAVEDSLPFQPFFNSKTQSRQGPLLLPATVVLLLNSVPATFVLLLILTMMGSYHGQPWTQLSRVRAGLAPRQMPGALHEALCLP